MDIDDLQPLVEGRIAENGNGSILQNGRTSYGMDKNAVNFDFEDVHTLQDAEDTPFISSPNSTLLEPPWSPRANLQRIDQESQPILDQKKSSRAYIDDAVSRHRSVALGMPLPTWYNEKPSKKSKHHRKHHKSDRRSQKQQKEPEREVLPPQQQVQFLLGGEQHDEDGVPTSDPCIECDGNLPKLFTEMEELHLSDNGEPFWKETARWIKFEECVEEGGDRWSKPHVATLSLHSLLELRSCLLNGIIQLDMDANSLEQIADMVLDILVSKEQLPYDDELRDKVKYILLSGHEHQKDGKGGSMNPVKSMANMMSRKESSTAMKNTSSGANFQRKSSGSNLQRKSSGSNMQRKTTSFNGGSSTLEKSPSSPTSPSIDSEKKKMPYFMKKIPVGAEASNVMVGEADFLDRPVIVFIRLQQGLLLEGITEVPIPTRFLFLLLGPQGNRKRYHEIGRSIGTLMSDEVFHDVAYKARTRQDLLAGIDEFLDQVTVLPPNEWDPKIRIEPPQDLPKSQMPRLQSKKEDVSENGYLKLGSSHGVGPELERTGRLFGGLIADIKRKIPFYASDFKDAISLQCIASMIFLYFAVLTPIVTFGGLLGDATQNSISAIESIFGGALAGSVYHLCSGQPLTIIGSTGPILVFETIMFDICSSAGIEYLSIRWWVGVWTGLFCIILVATDASSLVQYITRYTEESFSALISLIFIYEAFKKLAHVEDGYPIWHGWEPDDITFYGCSCLPRNITGLNATQELDFEKMKLNSKEHALKSHGTTISGSLYRSGDMSYSCAYDGAVFNVSDINAVNWTDLNRTECVTMYCGDLEGESCGRTPDVMLMSVILFFGTFSIAWTLKAIKLSNFFPSKVRSVISDFAVTIGIFLMVLFDIVMKLDTPKLTVPGSFRPTRDDRGWIIPPLGKNEWWTIPLAILPALLCTILIFMDQQITAVIVNRKENKLKKGAGYHLDLLIVAVMMIICSVLGLPWFVAATVLSITHVNSLKMESETSAPGEVPRYLGVREQRVTGIMIFLLIGVSIFMTPILAYIPMPVLYGVFLYMGVSSLKGVQFIDRCLLFFMPSKHQPDYVYLRHVPLPKVYLFTFFQALGLATLWVIKSMKPVSIIFPMMVAALVGVRKLFDFAFFTQEDLFWLDDIMPESAKKKKEDKKKKQRQDTNLLPISGQGTVNVRLQDGKVLKIPASEIAYNPNEPTSINISNEMGQTAIWKTIVRNELGSGVDLKSREKLVRTNSSGIAIGRTNSVPDHQIRIRGQSSADSDSTTVVIES